MEDTRGITEVWEALREVLAAQSGIYALLNDIRHDIDRSERSVSERLDAMSDVILGFQPQAQQPTEPPKTREQCPDVLFWDQEPWETMSNGKHGDSSPAASALLQLPSSETVIAKKLRFIQTDLGVLVSPERLGAITQGGRGQFEKMILAKVAPYNWETNVSADVRDDFCLSMERAYPELGLCSNHWKANKLAIIIYPGFKRTRRVYFDALRKVMKKDKGKNKSSAEPEDDEGEDVSEDERGDEGDTPTGEQQEEGQQRPHAALPTRKEKRAATTSDQSLQPRKKKKTENSWISSLRKTQLQPEASRNVSSMPVAPGGPSSVPSEELSVVSTSFEASSGVHTSSRVAGLPEPLCSIADSASHPDVSPTSSTAGATEPGASLTSSPLHSSSAPSGPRSSSTPSVSGASPTVSASVPSSIPSALGLSPTPSPPGSSAASSPSASLSAHSASGSLSNPSASGCSSSPASSSLRDSSLAPQASASGSSARPQSVASSLSTTTSARAPSSSSRSILLQSPRSPPPEGMRDAAPNSGVSLRDPSPDPSRPEISSSAAPGPDPHVQERAGSSAGPNPTPASSSSESPSGSTIDGQPAHPKGKLYQPGPRNTMKNLFGRDWIATRSGTEAEFKKAYKAFEEDEPRKTAFIKNLESMNVKIVQAGGRRRATEGSHPSWYVLRLCWCIQLII
ncbi:hypothetical protein PsYK624_091070 [Phanerochaete sordida]|uniref:Uncharacterized protein n=1 Tax=Phanerochaete sordida TaxID=48140 RepID=A0A9P3GDL2_9APHY|nr:hypothetical protein PsYK624_091070 [Phanerochaete sordida]